MVNVNDVRENKNKASSNETVLANNSKSQFFLQMKFTLDNMWSLVLSM